ncbi:MAG: LUD domain-containing protein [Anaerolineales bacterium]|nr:LUD domain-containing protein [Anaerolineales bacterium]
MRPFTQRIRRSLADANLQQALDANAERRIAVRQQAIASLAEPQAMRQQAHHLRAEVVEHLDAYLDQFTARLHEHGVIVHRAAIASQAVQIVQEIASRQGARLVAKSKTILSEELELNPALQAAGLRVIETDLGEYIVQLREEPPSHIITPAVHLRRQDVGLLFHEKLGIPLTDEIPVMTAAARKALREVFLSADIGISGVNFGVAETGTLCLLTNEGNGRMVTTIPRVHIALMGLERLVPTLSDLALMLALLPRSATGQKITVYASLLHGPRRAEDADGPQERHLILVDNGRLALRQSPLREILYCIRCGACLNACPVFREIGGHAYVGRHGKGSVYPGPMGSVLAPGLFGWAEFGHLARASSLCGACREACPVDIDLPRLLLRVRAGMVSEQSQAMQSGVSFASQPNTPWVMAFGLRVFTWIAASQARYSAAQRLAGWLGRVAAPLLSSRGKPAIHPGLPDIQPHLWLRLPSFTGWGYSKEFPVPAAQSFRQRWASNPRHPPLAPPFASQSFPLPAQPQQPVPATASDPQLRLQRFAAELAALGAHFFLVSKARLPQSIFQALHERGIQSLLAWEDVHLPPGLLAALSQQGIQVFHPTAETIPASSQVRAGLTAALGAAAETGSLLLVSGPGRPLVASLLPEVHLVVLSQADVVDTMEQLLGFPALQHASAVVLISGPSRTADIEMTLTIGVHGPGELLVFCVK